MMSELDQAIAQHIGKMILEERKKQGWTQLELAGRADVSPSAVSLIESGNRRPLLPNFAKIAHALGWENRKISEFVDLAWKPLPYGRVGMRLEIVSADNSADSPLCNMAERTLQAA